VKLTVVIVNYNVEHFLEQCLLSVRKAMETVDGEVYVVDNNSVDGSVALVESRFPEVKLIANKDNGGFSKANNQAMRVAKGEYILLLNPDTVVQEDTFEQVVNFMDAHPDAGGLGVKMVDGKGIYLPESKRGLPVPKVAFWKMSGLYRLFPKSKRLNYYYLGHLGDDDVNEIEILSGAFMLMRKEALDKVGLLDEDFFMYGEDIDLSWRIIQGGYKNYYYPKTSIIHYKGESTKKGSLNYVFVFYNAMVIFARKHFSEKNAKAFSTLINVAIYGRAFLSICKRMIEKIWLPALDFSLIVLGLLLSKSIYEVWKSKIYDPMLALMAFAAYAVVWLLSVYFSGGYDKPVRLLRLLRGIVIGSAIILSVYALLPESVRFSRALVLIGTGITFLSFGLTRGILHTIWPASYSFLPRKNKRFLLVGFEEEANRVSELLAQTSYQMGELTIIDPESEKLNNLGELVRVYGIEEVIFCAKDVSSGRIISLMSQLDNSRLDFKIAPPESLYIIGSNSIHTSGDLFIMDVNSVSRTENQRKKRLVDVLASLTFLIALPVLLFIVKKPGTFCKNIFQVLFGAKTWVGFHPEEGRDYKLPRLRRGVLTTLHPDSGTRVRQQSAKKLNILYAKDYRAFNDLNIIARSIKYLGAN
jgi:O-antigen biosynthesis protein